MEMRISRFLLRKVQLVFPYQIQVWGVLYKYHSRLQEPKGKVIDSDRDGIGVLYFLVFDYKQWVYFIGTLYGRLGIEHHHRLTISLIHLPARRGRQLNAGVPYMY